MNGNEHALLEKVADDLTYVRGRVDDVDLKVSDLRVQVEHRLTKLEVRASIIALFISTAISVAAALTR